MSVTPSFFETNEVADEVYVVLTHQHEKSIFLFFSKKNLPAVCSISQIFQTISNRQHLSGTANLNLYRMMVLFSRFLFNKSSEKKGQRFFKSGLFLLLRPDN